MNVKNENMEMQNHTEQETENIVQAEQTAQQSDSVVQSEQAAEVVQAIQQPDQGSMADTEQTAQQSDWTNTAGLHGGDGEGTSEMISEGQVTAMLYDQIMGVFGEGTQLFTMEMPGRVLNQLDYA